MKGLGSTEDRGMLISYTLHANPAPFCIPRNGIQNTLNTCIPVFLNNLPVFLNNLPVFLNNLPVFLYSYIPVFHATAKAPVERTSPDAPPAPGIAFRL